MDRIRGVTYRIRAGACRFRVAAWPCGASRAEAQAGGAGRAAGRRARRRRRRGARGPGAGRGAARRRDQERNTPIPIQGMYLSALQESHVQECNGTLAIGLPRSPFRFALPALPMAGCPHPDPRSEWF
jgi:hypothetical protein